MKVLDIGEVSIVDYMGRDSSVVRAARVSNGIFNQDWEDQRDEKLINYLMKHRHGSPFEHNSFTFYVKAPIFVTREWQRHRIGSFNEISGRYVEFEPEFYVPDRFRTPAATNKQGSVIPDDKTLEWHESNKGEFGRVINDAFASYKTMLQKGVAKEMARMILPLNLYTQFYWTINARSLMNFLSLRTASDAQWEIQQYANAIENIWGEMMPVTWRAWINNGRLAP